MARYSIPCNDCGAAKLDNCECVVLLTCDHCGKQFERGKVHERRIGQLVKSHRPWRESHGAFCSPKCVGSEQAKRTKTYTETWQTPTVKLDLSNFTPTKGQTR